jgi:hypothetical protein
VECGGSAPLSRSFAGWSHPGSRPRLDQLDRSLRFRPVRKHNKICHLHTLENGQIPNSFKINSLLTLCKNIGVWGPNRIKSETRTLSGRGLLRLMLARHRMRKRLPGSVRRSPAPSAALLPAHRQSQVPKWESAHTPSPIPPCLPLAAPRAPAEARNRAPD